MLHYYQETLLFYARIGDVKLKDLVLEDLGFAVTEASMLPQNFMLLLVLGHHVLKCQYNANLLHSVHKKDFAFLAVIFEMPMLIPLHLSLIHIYMSILPIKNGTRKGISKP